MIQSAIVSLDNSPQQPTLKNAWNIGSVVVSIAAIIVSTMALAVRRPELGQMILLASIATFFIVVIMHARFLYLAHDQNRQTTDCLWTKECEFQSIFENAFDAILVLDDEGVCRNANPSANIFFSTAIDRLIRQPVRAFYANAADFDSMWGQLQAHRRHQGETELVRSDGATVFAEFAVMPNFLPKRHLMILRDITSRRRAQQAVTRGLMVARSSWQQAETLRKASIALTEDLRMNSVLDALLHTLSDFVPYERAQLFLLETDSKLFLAHEATNLEKPILETGLPETFDISDLPILRRVFASTEGILFEDASNERDWRPSSHGKQVRSWIGVPIISSNQVLGLLSLTDSNPAQFSAIHLALARSLATPAAVAIQNARLYERAEIYGAELERRIAELRDVDQDLHRSEYGNRRSAERFERIFRSVPVAISVSSLVDGEFLEFNETFERSFGFPRKNIASGIATEFDLWEDPRERTKLIDRLGRRTQVHNAVARFRQRSGIYQETMYSAAVIDIEGQPCLLVAVEDQVNPI